MTLDQISIVDAWKLLGGELRGHRGKRFWLDGDGWNVSLNSEKNVYFDHVDARGGGVLDLVMVAKGYTKQDALRWLEANCGLDTRRPLSPQEKREYALQAAGTERLAQRLADFASGLELIAERTTMGLYEYLSAAGIDAPETLGRFQHQLFILKTAHAQDLAHVWRNARTMAGEVERVGREHREHAESVTRMIVDMLACASATEIAA